MKAELVISNPDALEATVTITATVGELRKMKEQLAPIPSSFRSPVDELKIALKQAILSAETHFYGYSDK